MVSEVLYRKWRPQTLANVVGQGHVTQTLLNALSQQRVAHAYLFSGPRGTGKTSTARILARAINCSTNGKNKPCNECLLCQAAAGGNALDIIEIDAASNRGIDEVRELRDRANYLPAEALSKVYIIDEVHMMTTQAFNALLKILEEPPAHVIFILATTEGHKVPSTIVSRCQRFDFRRLSREVLEDRIRNISEAEGMQVDPWVIRFVAKTSDGSLRDAENLLEQLLVSYGSSIEPTHLKNLLGISTDLPLNSIVSSMLNGNLKGSLIALHRISTQGLNLNQFHREVLEYLRSVMLVKAGAEDITDLVNKDLEEVHAIASNTTINHITQAMGIWGDAYSKLNHIGPLALETALIEVSLISAAPFNLPSELYREIPESVVKDDSETNLITKHYSAIEKSNPQLNCSANGVQSNPGISEPAKIKNSLDITTTSTGPIENSASDTKGDPSNDNLNNESDQTKDIDTFKRKWPELVDALRGVGSKGSLDALLRSACEPVALDGETLVVGFYHDFHKSKIENPKYRHLVEKKVNEVFGVPYKIRCNLLARETLSQSPKPQNSQTGSLVQVALDLGAKIINPNETYGK